MKRTCYSFVDVVLWGLVMHLALYIPHIEMRIEEAFEQPSTGEQIATTEKPEPVEQYLQLEKCFHVNNRSKCPPEPGCVSVGALALFCCDLNTTLMKETLAPLLANKSTKYLHVSNASIKELDVSQAMYKRLTSMAFTDGHIGQIVRQFPKNSALACLNISNNNLTSDKVPSKHRPFAYLFNLTVLDASANNLTELPIGLVHSNRNISVALSGNNWLPCKHFQKAMEFNNISKVQFLNYNETYCTLDLHVSNWVKDVQVVPIDYLREQKELSTSCSNIKPANINCTCASERLEKMYNEVTRLVSVDCSQRHLKEMPTELPPNTVKLNVSYNNITSLEPVSDPTYDHVRQLYLDYNDVPNILELEGTKFIDNFIFFSISYNKLNKIHTYVLSNRIETKGPGLSIAGNSIHCDCNTEKMLKPWLLENSKGIPDYKLLMCENNMGPVVDLVESHVCHSPRDWTDYIYYIIGLEVFVLVLLISKVSYDYWVFKTAGYLPWPANKMPRLPCDWLCE